MKHFELECSCHGNGSYSDKGLISRRSLILGLLGTAMAACAAPIVRTPKEEVAEFPLIDAHSHYNSKHFTPEELLRAMDIAGIRRMIVLGFGPEVFQLARKKPDRFVASYVGDSFRSRQARGEIKDGTSPPEVDRISAEFEKALRSGLYQGIGEIHTYADPWIPFLPGTNIAPDSPLINRLLELAGQHGMPINIHCTNTGAKQMARSLRAYPKTMVVWAHTGSYLSPSNISSFLREYPNIAFDLSAKNPACCPAGYSQNYPLMGIRSIDETWRKLFEAYPDRFLVGVDFFSSSALRYAREAGEFYRTILGQLTPATARKIGYQNAQKLYGLG